MSVAKAATSAQMQACMRRTSERISEMAETAAGAIEEALGLIESIDQVSISSQKPQENNVIWFEET